MRALFQLLISSLLPSLCAAATSSGGSLQTYFRQYGFSQTNEVANKGAGFDGDFKFDWNDKKRWKLKTDIEFRTDYLTKDSGDAFTWNPSSLYLELKANSLKTRAGFQTLIPEGPDFLNPLDVIHSKNWVDPTIPTHLSSAGLSLAQEIDEWQWDVLYIPRQTEPILPGERSAWWPREKRLPLESENMELLVSPETRYKINSPIEIDQALKNNFAFRLGKKGENFEFQTVYYEGLAQDPYLKVDIDATLVATTPKTVLLLNSPVRLTPFYYKHRAVAGSFVLPRGSWALRGAANWLKPLGDDSRIPGETHAGVLGVEKSFETRRGLVTVIFQHEEQKRQIQDQFTFLRSLFENAWSLGLRVPWGEDFQLMGGVIYDSVGKSSLVKLTASQRLTDSLSAGADATFLQGPDDTLLGLYDRYDYWGLNLTYHW